LSMAALLFSMAVALVISFVLQLAPFTGPNTLVFAASLSVAAISILSDYLLTREMIYRSFSVRKSKPSLLVDRLLGLNRGTDRLFKLAGIFLIAALVFFGILLSFAINGKLSLDAAALTGLLACTFALSSVLIYLTATKITSYRSLHGSS